MLHQHVQLHSTRTSHGIARYLAKSCADRYLLPLPSILPGWLMRDSLDDCRADRCRSSFDKGEHANKAASRRITDRRHEPSSQGPVAVEWRSFRQETSSKIEGEDNKIRVNYTKYDQSL